VGTHTITYTFGGSCGDVDTETIIVHEQSNAAISPISALCEKGAPVILTAADNGGSWSADCGACINATTGEFNPLVAGVGTWMVTYTVGTFCPDTQTSSVSVSACLGLDENTNGITIYPNPANEFVILSSDVLMTGTVIVKDIAGREIYRTQLNSTTTTIPVNHLSDGTYFIAVLNEDGSLVKVEKLVKH
jgi:hypothetical protein